MSISRQIAAGDTSLLALTVLAKSGVAVPLTGGTAETVFATIAIPANSLGLNGLLRVTMNFSCTANANNKTLRLRLGGAAGTAIYTNIITTTTTGSFATVMMLNRNSTSSQISIASGSRSDNILTTQSPATAVVDMTASQDLVIAGQLANGADTLTLEAYVIEYMK